MNRLQLPQKKFRFRKLQSPRLAKTENKTEVFPEDLARELGASSYAPETAGRDEAEQEAGEGETAPKETNGNTSNVPLRRSAKIPKAKVRQILGAIKYV